MSWRPNRGKQPRETVGKMVKVRLGNGSEHVWPADSKAGAKPNGPDWTLSNHPAAIVEWDFA